MSSAAISHFPNNVLSIPYQIYNTIYTRTSTDILSPKVALEPLFIMFIFLTFLPLVGLWRVYPEGIWYQNDILLTSMRRDDVISTLIRRHFGTKCPLGNFRTAEATAVVNTCTGIF